MSEPQNQVDYKNMIEALFFASGRFMTIDALLNLTGASGKQVLVNNIEKLKKEYEERHSPLMLVEEKDGWKLTVREAYLPLVRKIVSETELPKTILETLAVIAWKAPVLQSEIIDIRHNKAYDHIEELEELGFIKKEKQARSYILKLSEKFFEYFDVAGAKDIRQVFSKVVGKSEQSKVDDFEENPLLKELTKEKPGEESPAQKNDETDAKPDESAAVPAPEEFSELDEPENQEEKKEPDDSQHSS